MLSRTLIALCSLLFATAAAADDVIARHNSTTTDASGTVVSTTETIVDSERNVRVNNYVVGGAISMTADEAAAGPGTVTSTQTFQLDDSMVFDAVAKRISFSDGRQCQHLSEDMEAPPGYPAGGMPDMQNPLAGRMAEMDRALAELAQQDPRMAEQLRRSLEGMQAPGSMVQNRNALEIIETGRERTFGDYETLEFEVRKVATGDLMQTVYAAPVDSVPNGRQVSEGMLAMYAVIQQAMRNMGVEQLTGSSLMGAIMEKMRDYYPILIIDHEDNSRTMLSDVNTQASANFELQCDSG